MNKVSPLFLLLGALSASAGCLLEIVNPFVCRPGQQYRLGCNSCRCPDAAGPGVCSLMECPLGNGECIPGSYFMVSRELCACPENGRKWDSNCFRRIGCY